MSADAIATVGPYTITKAMLNEWMTELAGEEYYRAMSQPAPVHLVKDPPDIQACAVSLATVAPNSPVAELNGKCETLSLSMRKQTLDWLVSTYWHTNYAQLHGLAVSEAEAKRGLEVFRRREFPNESDFRRMLASRRRTVAEELFLVKDDLLEQKVLKKVAGLGRQALAAFIAGIALTTYSAHCRAGYVVEHCLGYKASSEASTNVPPSGRVFEEIARWRSS